MKPKMNLLVFVYAVVTRHSVMNSTAVIAISAVAEAAEPSLVVKRD